MMCSLLQPVITADELMETSDVCLVVSLFQIKSFVIIIIIIVIIIIIINSKICYLY